MKNLIISMTILVGLFVVAQGSAWSQERDVNVSINQDNATQSTTQYEYLRTLHYHALESEFQYERPEFFLTPMMSLGPDRVSLPFMQVGAHFIPRWFPLHLHASLMLEFSFERERKEGGNRRYGSDNRCRTEDGRYAPESSCNRPVILMPGTYAGIGPRLDLGNLGNWSISPLFVGGVSHPLSEVRKTAHGTFIGGSLFLIHSGTPYAAFNLVIEVNYRKYEHLGETVVLGIGASPRF